VPKCDTILHLDTPFLKKENIVNRLGRDNPAYLLIQDDLKRTNLRAYDKGYDSIAIRLFYNYFGPEIDIVEIRKHCEGWIAQFIKIKRHSEKERVMVDVVENKFISPESGWTNFTSKIFALGITSLPDYSEIPDYNPENDGHSLTVEIATAKYYRIYTYLNPKTKPNIPEAKKIEEIMELIEQEFGIKRKTKI
jgi:hypothetical protein